MTRTKLKKELIDFSFLLPGLILFSLFVLATFIQGLPIAFFDWDGFSKTREFVGIQNFIDIFSDRNLANAIGNSLEFTLYNVLFSNIIGLVSAILLQKKSRENNILRTVRFMPFVWSLVLSSIVWTYVYSNVVYRYFGIPTPLGNAGQVVAGLGLMAIWRDSGYCMIIYIAALKGVPNDFYEASYIEGAGPFRRFFTITLPLIVPAITANVTLLLSWGLKMFDYAMVATSGGPGRASETFAMVVYRNIFEYYHAGYGQAMSIVMTIAIFIVSASTARFFRSREIEL